MGIFGNVDVKVTFETTGGIFVAWRDTSGRIDNGWFYSAVDLVRWLKAFGSRISTIEVIREG